VEARARLVSHSHSCAPVTASLPCLPPSQSDTAYTAHIHNT
jgi:hypothetical protein